MWRQPFGCTSRAPGLQIAQRKTYLHFRPQGRKVGNTHILKIWSPWGTRGVLALQLMLPERGPRDVANQVSERLLCIGLFRRESTAFLANGHDNFKKPCALQQTPKSWNMEHRCRMIHVGCPAFFRLELEDGHVPSVWTLYSKIPTTRPQHKGCNHST